MHRISKCSQGLDHVQLDDIKMATLLFADDVVLLALSDRHLQCALEWFTSECDAGRTWISPSKSETEVFFPEKKVNTTGQRKAAAPRETFKPSTDSVWLTLTVCNAVLVFGNIVSHVLQKATSSFALSVFSDWTLLQPVYSKHSYDHPYQYFSPMFTLNLKVFPIICMSHITQFATNVWTPNCTILLLFCERAFWKTWQNYFTSNLQVFF